MSYLDDTTAQRERDRARDYPSIALNAQQLGWLELLLAGALSPLEGYPDRQELASIETHGRLLDGRAWSYPLVLEIPSARESLIGQRVALRDHEGVLIGVLDVRDQWPRSARASALAGPVSGVSRPSHYAFETLYPTPLPPGTTRPKTLAVPISAPISAPLHADAVERARRLDAQLVWVDSIATPALDDDRLYARLRWQHYWLEQGPVTQTLRLLPIDAPSDARSRRCLVHMLANLGYEHCLIARSWRELIETDPPALTCHYHDVDMQPNAPISGLETEWQRLYPRRDALGFTLFFTGLSGSGKSTLANAVLQRLLHSTSRRVSLLDGDRVRHHLSSELGFSRAHRDLNILRIGYVASEISKHGGIAICAPIAPFAATRAQVREMIEAQGGFVEIHVATPLEVCEARDRKGLYAKARAGLIKEFTGISDPYEAPTHPELTIDTSRSSIADASDRVLAKLVELGYLTSLP